jgi:DNA-binding MarR family transcriptional regulator
MSSETEASVSGNPRTAGAVSGEAPVDPEQVAGALLVSVGLLRRRLRQVPMEGELTLPQASVLARLDRKGPTTASALAKIEQISPQSMGATLASLEARGLVGRHADPGDGRRVVLSVTQAGLEVLRHRRDTRTAHLAQALSSGFTPAELGLLTAVAPLLERLAQSI